MSKDSVKRLVEAGPRMTLIERLAQLVSFVGGVTRAAEIAGVSRQTVDNWRAGRTEVGMNEALRLATACSVSLDWIATGHDRRPDLPSVNGARSGFSIVYRYETGPQGQLVGIEDSTGAAVAFRETWLKELGIEPGQAALLAARGDTMLPTIRDGDLLVIDRGVSRIAGDGIYVLARGGAPAVRRAQVLVDGSVMLIADNTRYHPEKVDAAQVASIAVSGRVRLALEFL